MRWQLLLAAGSSTVHVKTVFHSKVTRISLLQTSSIPARKAQPLQLTRPLFCRSLCFGRRWGRGKSSCWWDVPTVEIRKCQDFMVMSFPHSACCLVNAEAERDARLEWQVTQQGLQHAIKSRAKPYAKLLLGKRRQGKKIKLLKHFSMS